MKILKWILLALFSLIVVLVLASFLLPQRQHVERSIEISAPAEKIYPHLADPKLFIQWSPWSTIDPKMKVQYTGSKLGKGAGMMWQSDDSSVGSGSWKITNAIENKSLDVAMDFGDQGSATSFFRLQPKGDKTQVIWGFDTDAGNNPMMRWFGLLMDNMVGSEYAKGLETLKAKLEK